jgi:hypothetical protein
MNKGTGFKLFILVFACSIFAFILLVLFPRNKKQEPDQALANNTENYNNNTDEKLTLKKRDEENKVLKNDQVVNTENKQETNTEKPEVEEKKIDLKKENIKNDNKTKKINVVEFNNILQSISKREDRIKYFEKSILPNIDLIPKTEETTKFFLGIKYDISNQLKATDKINTTQINIYQSYLNKIKNYE